MKIEKTSSYTMVLTEEELWLIKLALSFAVVDGYTLHDGEVQGIARLRSLLIDGV